MGANGVGKSSICDGLAKDPNFKRIERDTRLEELWNEFGGYENFVRILNGERKARIAMVNELRKRINELIRLLAKREAVTKPKGKTFLDALRNASRQTDDQLIQFYSRSEDLLYYLVRFLAEERGINEAIEATKKSDLKVLLDDPRLDNESDDAAEARKYLEGMQIEPSLLIIRATRERIRKSAMERFRSGATQGVWKGRAAAGLAQIDNQIHLPYARRVIVHDNLSSIEDSIATVRKRILSENFDTVNWPLPLAVD